MSISFKVLGGPGEDNALHAVVDTGQSLHPLLFDCGEGCAARLRVSECQAIQHLCFSHFHMDHIAGFDTFFRHNFNRPDQPVHVWGPEQSIDVLYHRFRGFSWNLHEGQQGEWRVHEILETRIKEAAFFTTEAFAQLHERQAKERTRCQPAVILADAAFRIEAFILNHGTTPSIGYRLVESDGRNIDTTRLAELGMQPGRWLGKVTDTAVPDRDSVLVGNAPRRVGDLRKQLIVSRPGASLAYLTDFALTDHDRDNVVQWLKGTDTLVCEAQYRHDDASLAARNHHMTTRLVGELARDAEVGELILQHISRRYTTAEWREMLTEARAIFTNTRFPDGWDFFSV
ncbi:MAG: ribonuclease Z [Verrucomicrobiae bacterium]|nr:ribonuclease Z [Verrucomicrobiae bacterium]